MASALQRAYENLRTGEAVFRDAQRFRQIATVLIRHGFGAALQELSLRDEWLVKKLLELRSAPVEHLPFEKRVLLAIQELGPTFVKLGQILSTRPDLLPGPLIHELRTLQDAVPPMPLEDVRATIRNELGAPPEEVFESFDPRPLASASIAQVHRARLRDTGAAVVVKVQRPNIRRQIEADLEIMGFLARGLEANFPEAQLYSPVGMVAEFERAIRREIDFTNEIDHIERFRANFHDHAHVHFPAAYRRLSTSHVLTMEFVDGTKITSITPEAFPVERIVRTALNAVLKMIHVDGFFHGDLHPGNLLVRPDGTVCFIDFGLCGRLSQRQRDHLLDMLIGVVRQDFPAVARTFWKIGIHGKQSTRDYERFESDVIERLDYRFAGKTIGQVEFSGVFKDIVDLALRHRIRMPADYTMTFKAVVTMEGVAKQLVPDLDIAEAVQPYIGTMLAERYNPRRLIQNALEAVRDLSETIGVLPDTTRGILEDLRAGRTQLNVELTHLEELQRAYARTQNRNMLALFSAVGALCGTLALDYTRYTVLGFPALSFLFFLGTGVFGALYFLSGTRR